ncbi:membrane hypothetical protein [Crenothrix polyspora]|uniref:Uncharacterized protein n=1 Tax=Crenothrix polyspora TaxID=360316 RepID=A0A1R4GZF1_9GAMM|nr:hypothetical protein [Crenothrix polyspora]SJM89367.1 membrane hypothetical protein [Crenothrix polyspora]
MLRKPFIKTTLFLIAWLWLSVWLFFAWASIDQGIFDYTSGGSFWQRTGGSPIGFLREIMINDLFSALYGFGRIMYVGIINSPLWITLVALWAAIAAIELAFSGISKNNVRHGIIGVGLWLIADWGIYGLGIAHA